MTRFLVLAAALLMGGCAFSGSVGAPRPQVTREEINAVLKTLSEQDGKQDAAIKALAELLLKEKKK